MPIASSTRQWWSAAATDPRPASSRLVHLRDTLHGAHHRTRARLAAEARRPPSHRPPDSADSAPLIRGFGIHTLAALTVGRVGLVPAAKVTTATPSDGRECVKPCVTTDSGFR